MASHLHHDEGDHVIISERCGYDLTHSCCNVHVGLAETDMTVTFNVDCSLQSYKNVPIGVVSNCICILQFLSGCICFSSFFHSHVTLVPPSFSSTILALHTFPALKSSLYVGCRCTQCPKWSAP